MTARARVLTAAPRLAAMLLVMSCAEPTAPAVSSAAGVASTDVAPGAALISCPTDVTVSGSGTIGMLGGQVSAGGTTISIPSGAVLSPTTFDVTVPASPHMEVAIDARGHEHFQFLVPATVSIDYSRCSDSALGDRPLVAYYIDDLTKSLLELMLGSDDRANRRYEFTTGHLSGYAIAN